MHAIPEFPARVSIKWLDILESSRPDEPLARHTFHSVSVFEAAVRLLAVRGVRAVVAVTWCDGKSAGFAVELERDMAANPEPFFSHVRAKLAAYAVGDVAELRDEARRLLTGYQVGS
jgi:hypothetical protein